MECIDLLTFLRNYYGIVNQNLKINRLSHMDMRILFPNVKRGSFEYLDNNQELVYNGDIILVYDCYGFVLPYINPRLDIISYEDAYDEYADHEKIDISDVDLEMLSKNELLTLRRKLKNNHQFSDEKMVVKAIRKKKDRGTIRYKQEKRLLKMED